MAYNVISGLKNLYIYKMISRVLLLAMLLASGSVYAASDDFTIDFGYSLRETKFGPYEAGKSFSVSTLEVADKSNTYASDKIFLETGHTESHKLHSVHLVFSNYHGVYEEFVSRMNLAFATDFDFEFFHGNLNYMMGYDFNIANRFAIGPLWSMSYKYMGSTMYFSTEPDYSSSTGDKDTLYTIRTAKPGSPETTAMVTYGPHIFNTGLGLSFTAMLIDGFFLNVTYIFNGAEHAIASNSKINEFEVKGEEIPSYVFGQDTVQESYLEVGLFLDLEELDIDFVPINISYIRYKYPTIGNQESGLVFAVVGEFD